jgi:hypothetical protein
MPVFSFHITHGSKGDARQLFIICSRSGAAHERFPSLNRCGQGWRTTRFDAGAIPVSARHPGRAGPGQDGISYCHTASGGLFDTIRTVHQHAHHPEGR